MERPPIHPVLAGLGANLLGSVTGAVLLTISGFTGLIDSLGQIVGGTVAVAIYGFIIALPFVFAYGIPTYALLNRYGLANLGTSLLFGLMPGVAWVLWTHSSWIDPVLWNGTLIAIFYFVLRQWHPHPNFSFKRDALKRAP
jgi:putative exporter of polyketide antibiotics